jgi:hypothetical protein
MHQNIKPIITLNIITILLSTSLSAIELEEQKGKLDGKVKVMSILDGKDNGYDPNNGTAYLLKVKYETPSWNNLKLGLAYYGSADLFGLTDYESERVARGIFVNDDGDFKGQLGELYLKYQDNTNKLFAGRMVYNSPLTTNAISLMPNFHTAFGGSTNVTPTLKLELAQITEISFGARSMGDFGLIGEGTKSAGAALKTGIIGQSEFHSISKATLGEGAKDTNGITVFNANYQPSKSLNLDVWDYYVDDMVNTIYLEAEKTIPLEGKKLKVNGQYLTQSETGDKLAGERDFSMIGTKASIGNKKWGAFAAYTQSFGDTAMLNAWGGDPGYTSTIFSRNEYREDVSSYKIGGRYALMHDLTLKGGYANYGQSKTLAPKKVLRAGTQGMTKALDDAEELDIVLVWKARKNFDVTLFHTKKTSEYNGVDGKDLTQAHTRIFGTYKF